MAESSRMRVRSDLPQRLVETLHRMKKTPTSRLSELDRIIAKEVGVGAKHIGMIRNGGYCGEILEKKLVALFEKWNNERKTKQRFRLNIEYDNEEEYERAKSLTMKERRGGIRLMLLARVKEKL